MRGPRSREAHAAINAFRTAGAPRGDRFHVAFRWWTCPFPAVVEAVPVTGKVLEVGCGHGLLSLYLALSADGRRVTGVDIDHDKLVLARAAAEQLEPADRARVTFVDGNVGAFVDGEFDAIVIADVLYLLPLDARLALLDDCAQHLAPGGRLVVKEADNRPRWKSAITVGQELLSTRVLRITEGTEVDFAPPRLLADRLRRAGLVVTERRIDRGYLHPHVLIVGTKP